MLNISQLCVKHARPVAHPVNNQIFQYDVAFYLGNLETNFIDTGTMKRSNERLVIVGIFSLYDPLNRVTYLRPCMGILGIL